ncbi:glutamate receptor 2-like [Varroa destructor]|uniref:Uncharacterized protein n=1 Tax=Varroa destructor TaxID=109461 RepID=A0A7M7K6D2_VARDE|nr:glutamate receptor 2-like [Varroa destructor]
MTAAHLPPWFFSNGTASWGPMQNLADTLAETLNYKYSMEAPEDGEWGVKIHDNWTGQIGMLYNNRTDIALGPIALTEQRFAAVDFSSMLTTDYLTILSGYPTYTQVNAFGFLMVFNWTVWLALTITIIGISLLSVYFEKVSCPENVFKHYLRRFSHYIETYLKAVFAESSVHLPRTDSLRVLLQVWWLGTIVLMTAYTGHMKATMMIEPDPIKIESMKQLAKKDMPVFVWRGSAYEALLKTSDSVDYLNVYNLVMKYQSSKETRELYSDATMDQVIRSKAVIMSSVIVMRYHVARTCLRAMPIGNYHFAIEGFLPHEVAMCFHRNLPRQITSAINKRIRWMVEQGLINRWLYSQYGGLDECRAMTKAGDPVRALNLKATQPMFLVWLSGLLISIFLVLVER